MIGDEGMLIEENVSADRVRYRFGLDEIRAKLNEKSDSTTSRAIRTSSCGLPLRRIRRKCEQCLTDNTIICQPLSFDQTKPTSSKNRSRINKNSCSEQKSAHSKNRALCVHENCNFHAQENCKGYCFAHYHKLCSGKQKQTKFRDASLKSERTEKTVVDEESKELLQSKPEIVDLTEDDN